MDFDYFYGRDAESFRFIRLPIVLIEDETFKSLSIDAKVLYSMYLSRSTLSYKNNWVDENGRVYIYFTVEETAAQLACGIKKAVKLIKDLEKIGLITKKRAGQGNPTKIYVKDFMSIFRNEELRSIKRENQDLSKGQVKNGDFDNSRVAKKESLDLSKRQPNYIENNKIDNSYIGNNTQDNLTLAPNEKGEIFAKVNSSNIEYKFNAVPTPNGGDIDIRYQIYQK